MTISSQLHSLVGWPNRSKAAIDREIDAEIDFHIECRTEDLIQSGLAPEAAALEAEKEFGSRDRIRRECQTVDYGNQTRWLMGLSAMCVLLIAAIGWLGHLLREANFQNQQMQTLLSAKPPMASEEAEGTLNPLDGVITDKDGKPVSGAKVLLIFKSWPDGRYQQESLEQTSDDEGKFQFPELYSTSMQTAFLVTVLADGQTMKSEYLVNKKKQPVKPFLFQLEPAIEKSLIITRNGKPIAESVVFPASRKPKGTRDEFLIYHQSGETAGDSTDEAGRIKLNLFQVGDKVDLTVIDGKEVFSIPIKIDMNPEQTISIPPKK